MLARGEIDAAIILTGHDNHHSIAIDAMRAGKHVLVEKPMAISVKAAQRMCEVADETGRVLSIAENVNFNPGTWASQWAVETGLIGDVQLLYRGVIGFRNARPDLVAARTPWRQSKLGAGGGVAIDLGVQSVNGVRAICGPVKSVQALWRTLEPVRVLMSDDDRAVVARVENQVDDAFFANFEFEAGGIGHLAVSRSARGTQVGVHGRDEYLGQQGGDFQWAVVWGKWRIGKCGRPHSTRGRSIACQSGDAAGDDRCVCPRESELVAGHCRWQTRADERGKKAQSIWH